MTTHPNPWLTTHSDNTFPDDTFVTDDAFAFPLTTHSDDTFRDVTFVTDDAFAPDDALLRRIP